MRRTIAPSKQYDRHYPWGAVPICIYWEEETNSDWQARDPLESLQPLIIPFIIEAKQHCQALDFSGFQGPPQLNKHTLHTTTCTHKHQTADLFLDDVTFKAHRLERERFRPATSCRYAVIEEASMPLIMARHPCWQHRALCIHSHTQDTDNYRTGTVIFHVAGVLLHILPCSVSCLRLHNGRRANKAQNHNNN